VADAKKKRTRPRDPNQLAKLVFDIASGDVEDTISESMQPSQTSAETRQHRLSSILSCLIAGTTIRQ
jgi:hypothetical protein